jgi:hypothetical protein
VKAHENFTSSIWAMNGIDMAKASLPSREQMFAYSPEPQGRPFLIRVTVQDRL